MATEEQQTELTWEEAVGRFLQENPGFLDRNPQLLRHLEIPHTDTGKAVSLIERQVVALRNDNLALETQLRQLVDIATDNDALSGQLHRFTIDLMLTRRLSELAKLATDGLKSRFNLDLAVFLPFRQDGLEGDGLVSADDPVIRQISAQVQQGQTICGVKLGPEEALTLLGTEQIPAGSMALIPVRNASLIGLLLIGSSDPERFASDMATTYLDRIGELLAVSLSLLSKQP
jgi:uncharacterized protein YigA (DUF484 family)